MNAYGTRLEVGTSTILSLSDVTPIMFRRVRREVTRPAVPNEVSQLLSKIIAIPDEVMKVILDFLFPSRGRRRIMR